MLSAEKRRPVLPRCRERQVLLSLVSLRPPCTKPPSCWFGIPGSSRCCLSRTRCMFRSLPGCWKIARRLRCRVHTLGPGEEFTMRKCEYAANAPDGNHLWWKQMRVRQENQAWRKQRTSSEDSMATKTTSSRALIIIGRSEAPVERSTPSAAVLSLAAELSRTWTSSLVPRDRMYTCWQDTRVRFYILLETYRWREFLPVGSFAIFAEYN